MEINQITQEIFDSAYKVHTALGPGLLESAYLTCLAYELRKKGLKVEEEKPVRHPELVSGSHIFWGAETSSAWRGINYLLKFIVELKTADSFTDVHFAQIIDLSSLRRKRSWIVDQL